MLFCNSVVLFFICTPDETISSLKDPALIILETCQIQQVLLLFKKLHFMSKIILGAMQTKSWYKSDCAI